MKVELCTQAQKEEALDVLCDAFHEYPVMRYVLADSGPDYDGALRALIDLFCQARLTHGLSLYGIRHEGPLVAVSVTSDPIERPTPPQLQETAERLIERIGQEAWDRLGRYDDACEAGDPGQPSHYLGMLGIVSSHQRQGVRQGSRCRDQGTCPLQRRFAGDSPQHGDGEEYPLLREARFQGRGGGRRRSRPYVEHVLVM